MLFNQGQQRLAQTKEIPVGDIGLLVVSVASLCIRVIANMAGVEGVQKLERAVVNRQPEDAHVVGVHHAMAKAHRLPSGHQLCGAFTDGLQQCGIGLGGIAAGGVMVLNDKVGQRLEFGVLIGVAEVFKMPEADKAR